MSLLNAKSFKVWPRTWK